MGARLTDFRVYDGPSLHSLPPSFRLTAETTGPWPAGVGLRARVLSWTPGLASRWPEQADASLALEFAGLLGALHSWTGCPPPASRAVERQGAAGVRLSAVAELAEARLAALCVEAAVELLSAAHDGDEAAAAASFERFGAAADALSGSNREILGLLRARGVPCVELGASGVITVGHGFKQRRLLDGRTDRTSEIAERIATRKDWANQVLREHGVPVPRQALVDTEAAALAAAARLGYPVAVKPVATDKGVGVTAGVQDPDALREAWCKAAGRGPVLVEQHLDGDGHRLLVMNGRLVVGSRLLSARVHGDGRSTVAELLARLNAERRREESSGVGLRPIETAPETERLLAGQGLDWDAVPKAGAAVRLRSVSNIAAGGRWFDCTAEVHPEVRALAERAAAAVGLDVAGVDLITTDVSRPPLPGEGVCEINPSPAIYGYTSDGLLSGAASAFIRLVLPDGDDGRIPLVAVMGPRGPEAARRTAAMLRSSGLRTAWAGRDGVRLDDELLQAGAGTGKGGARLALSHRAAEAAVLEMDAADVRRRGLAFHRAGALIMLGVAQEDADAAGLLLRTADRWVLNGADPVLRRLAGAAPAHPVIWLDGPDPDAAAAAAAP